MGIDRMPTGLNLKLGQVSHSLYVDIVIFLCLSSGTTPFEMTAYVTSPSGQLENCEIV